MAQELVESKGDGRFKPGTSGNPAGRPPSLRGEIGSIQELIEKGIRKKITYERVLKVVEATFKEALEGDSKTRMACRKLVFEYFIQKPKTVEESADTSSGITIRIENATFKAKQIEEKPAVIDGEVIEVKTDG